MREPAEFFETGKTYRLDRPDLEPGAWQCFRCFGATVVPEGAIGAGTLLAAGYESTSLAPNALGLVLMTSDAWTASWKLVEMATEDTPQ